MPKTISVIVPVLNMSSFIGPCLESVVAQQYPHVEIIVLDGGSTDGTAQIIERYASRLHYWVSEADKGQSNAINRGFAHATGDILAWLNGDEEYLPGTLEKVAAAFSENDRLDFVYADRLVCDAQGLPLHLDRRPRMHPRRYTLYYGRVLPTETSFWSRRVQELTGELDEEHFQHLAMDYDWFLRLGPHVRRYRKLDGALAKFKEHDNRKTTRAAKDHIEALWRMAREKRFEEQPEPPWRLLLGWALAAADARLQLRDLHMPRVATVVKMAWSGSRDREGRS